MSLDTSKVDVFDRKCHSIFKKKTIWKQKQWRILLSLNRTTCKVCSIKVGSHSVFYRCKSCSYRVTWVCTAMNQLSCFWTKSIHEPAVDVIYVAPQKSSLYCDSWISFWAMNDLKELTIRGENAWILKQKKTVRWNQNETYLDTEGLNRLFQSAQNVVSFHQIKILQHPLVQSHSFLITKQF